MSKVIAICGKGGADKTTLAALLSKAVLEHDDISTLFIDADPTGGLSSALNLPIKATINDLRKQLIAEVQRSDKDSRDILAGC